MKRTLKCCCFFFTTLKRPCKCFGSIENASVGCVGGGARAVCRQKIVASYTPRGKRHHSPRHSIWYLSRRRYYVRIYIYCPRVGNTHIYHKIHIHIYLPNSFLYMRNVDGSRHGNRFLSLYLSLSNTRTLLQYNNT